MNILRATGRCRPLFLLLLAALGASVRISPAWAQLVPPFVAPGAIERGLQNPLPESRDGEITIPAPQDSVAPSNAAGIRFTLQSVSIDGASVLPAAAIETTYRRLIGQSITLAELYDVANAITALYVKAGYAISFGLVPAQKIDASGHVTIAVVEGYVAEIEVAGASPRIAAVVRGYGRRIQASRPLKNADLERFLMLVNDLPGMTVKSVFNHVKDGERGATRLDMNVTFAPVQASVDVDNRGSRALGPWRTIVGLTIDSPLGLGDALTVRGLQTIDRDELSYGAASWSVPIDRNGTSLNLAVSNSASRPGTPALAVINFAGTGWIASGGLDHVLVRTRTDSLSVGLTGTAKWLDTTILAQPNSRDRIYTLDTAVSYVGRDRDGATSGIVRLTKGLDIFDATGSSSPLRSRSSGSGKYLSGQLSLGRLQDLGGPFQLNITAFSQIASRGLLASEQCGYGGGAFGRAFDDYEIAGDHCVMGSAELRYSPSWGQTYWFNLQFYGFGDAGMVWEAGMVLPGEPNSQTGRSVGMGVRVGLPESVMTSLEFDQPLGRDVAQENNRDSRLFLSLTKAF
jgi:hemolysin activation/secretion protein